MHRHIFKNFLLLKFDYSNFQDDRVKINPTLI